MGVKNCFIACTRLKRNGKLFKDDDGAFYLEDHQHPALAGKEFSNPREAAEAVSDWNAANPGDKFTGEFILLNIIEHS